jgi:hypothetical protein
MGRIIGFVGLCLAVAGCDSPPAQNAGDVYEAVLRQSLLGPGDGEGVYVHVDGKDPSADLLGRLHQVWPSLRPASETPKGKRHVIHVGELKWIGRSAAEVRGGFSNGMDGSVQLFRVVWKGGQWTVEKTTTEISS